MDHLNNYPHSSEKNQNSETLNTRNSLLTENPDRVFGVYSLLKNTTDSLELTLIENVVCIQIKFQT